MAEHDPAASFGELVRDYRRAAGLTQEELAERAGVSPRSISGLERGDGHIPRRDTVALVARALDLVGTQREAFEASLERRPAPRPDRSVERVTARAEPPPKTERAAHNLPRPLSSFVGRDQELDELARVLPGVPLLTLVGPGGVGKTRLAKALVRRQASTYADGSWLVELAALTDPALVPGAVAAAVGLGHIHAQNVSQSVIEYLTPRHMLLVFDNCEHLAGACAELAAQLLGACARLQVLATSREPLAIEGETTWRVPPLGLPQPLDVQPLDEILAAASVRLFVERARAANNALVLTDASASAIARICINLDGIPLALELAAARARVLPLEQLAERLEHDTGVLVGATRAGLPQHRTMRATIDWSHDLLSEQEQILLRRLSVFAGGWTLEASEDVCSGGGIERSAVLDVLAQLVDKSMVLADAHAERARYRLLEPIRQYAAERLEASGEAAVYRAQHADALLELVWTADAGLAGPNEISSLDRFEAELDNIRGALSWALTHDQGRLALRSSAALFRFWERRGHFQEACSWIEQCLAVAGDAPARDRGRALNALAFLYWRGGRAENAQSIAEESLAINRAGGQARDVAQSFLNLGMIAYLRHEHDAAVAHLQESVRLARQAAYQPMLSVALAFLGRALLSARGPLDAGVAVVLEESLAVAEAAQSRYARSHALATLGDLQWGQGRPERALRSWRHALGVASELADRRAIAGLLERLALSLAASGRLEPAAWLFGAAEAQHKVMGLTLRQGEQADHAHFVAVSQPQLGQAYAEPWHSGQTATVDEAVSRALTSTRSLQGGWATQSVEHLQVFDRDSRVPAAAAQS